MTPHFIVTEQDTQQVVAFWVEVGAKGKTLSSGAVPVQVHEPGKLSRTVTEHELWTDDTVATLAALVARVTPLRGKLEAAHARLSAAMEWRDARFQERRPLSVDPPTELEFESAKAESKACYDDCRPLETALAATLEAMATPEFFVFFSNVLIPLKSDDTADERAYALFKGKVWSCSRELEPTQWMLLIRRFVEREDIEFAAALADNDPSDRERIPTDVRRAVWIRDQGKCARCGSRERLEYDHIVPISRGGSNTERNVELLCELCNRAKSDAVE